MEIRNTITLLKIQLNNHKISELFEILNNSEYSDGKGFGFKNIQLEEDYLISGILVKRTPIFLNILDLDTKQIIKQSNHIFNEIEFYLDFKSKIVDLYANQINIAKFRSVFRNNFNDFVIINDLEISLSNIINKIKEKVKVIKIDKIAIKDFKYGHGLIGKYEAKNIDNQVFLNVIDLYKEEILKVSFDIILYNGFTAQITLDRLSKITIVTEEEYYFDILEFIKYFII